MNISKETLELLSNDYTFTLYDEYLNEVPVEKATQIHIGYLKSIDDYLYIGKTLKATKKEMTIDYIMNKLNADSKYINFSNKFNDLLKDKKMNCYATTYGIGVFMIGRTSNLEKANKEVSELLDSLGIKYSTEFSDAGYVFRYKISKSKENIENIDTFLNS